MELSRFSFGTGSLFNVGSARRRANLLEAAYSHGFTHFDTAPYYGFGTAERDLKPLLAAHPEITVATKVGTYSPGGEDQTSTAVFLRKAAGRVLSPLSRPTVDWSVARARKALTASLVRLGRERLDLYLLHDPNAALLNSEEWLRWLETERDRVRYFGIAINAQQLDPYLAGNSALAGVIQTIDSLDVCEADVVLKWHRPLQITYGYVSARARGRIGAVDVAAVLSGALRRNRFGSVIVTTGKVARLQQYVNISDDADRVLP
jgi:aryl-alcohol dehydrogenase-like predicted oxidoreductase